MSTRSSSPPAVPLPRAPQDGLRDGATVEREARGFRRGKLDAFAYLMGTMPDADVARLAGSSVAGVKAHRARHGIARWVGEAVGRRPAELPVNSARRRGPAAAPAGAPGSGLGVRGSAAMAGRGSVGLVALQSRPAAPARPARAFAADATGPAGSARVVVTGSDIVSAARVAEAVFALRPGGPWALRAVCDLGDAG